MNAITVTVQGQQINLPEGFLIQFNYTKGKNGKAPRSGSVGDVSTRLGYLAPIKDQPKGAIKIQVIDSSTDTPNRDRTKTFSLAGISDVHVYPQG